MTKIDAIAIENREILLPLLDLRSASDAILAYYAIEHPENKISLFANYSVSGRPNGFLISARTGFDLFRPLVLPAVASRETMSKLLQKFLTPPQPILIQIPLEQREWIEDDLDLTNIHISELLRLDVREFEPILNVLVIEKSAPDFRFEIHAKSGSKAIAGLNWKGSTFAEVYLEADREALERGLGISVLAAACSKLLQLKLVPLYRYEASSLEYSKLEELGFRSTGTRSIFADAQLKNPPAMVRND
jgi:hypothetical protein